MGFFTPLFTRRSGLAEVDFWLKDALAGGLESHTGVTVNESAALGNAAVFACVRVLSDTVGQLPLKVFRRLANGGRDVDPQHPLYVLLHDLPNPEVTASEFRAALMGHLCLWGNAYAEVEYDGLGRIKALWPLRPDYMTVTRNEAKQRVWLYRLPDGKEIKWTWSEPTLRPAPILHLRGLSPDGFVGYSPLRLMRESIGLALAAEEFGARLFANNARPSGVLTSPQVLTPEAAKRLKESWEAAHRGLSHAHRVAVLEQGVAWQNIGMPPEDAQLLETRKFQVSEIARIFRVPPHMIGDVERSTSWGTGIEQQQIGFLQFSIMPWLVAWEQAIARDLLTIRGWNTHEVRFVVNGLLRGDTASRFNAYAIGRQWGWLSVNDVRAFEDMNPVAGGDTYETKAPSSAMPAAAPPPVPDVEDDEALLEAAGVRR